MQEQGLASRYLQLMTAVDDNKTPELIPYILRYCEDCYALHLYSNAARGIALAISCCEPNDKILLSKLYELRSQCMSLCNENLHAAAATSVANTTLLEDDDNLRPTKITRTTKKAYKSLQESKQ
jgi:hypothetical protein